ncbi:alkaline phosphatase family protein [Paenibacillus sp. P96]|uniref:Alkaline phosphatase family protein n=1 Tax=Paenibacillus zeirhizosphaerae TaxID=2987519 RepID=A0ABT9FR42_9BACL|nr:alkaline phosphatase family protein [Paenibacillus sp. P96]MDP4097208.1 alkaline phosphatase family protein [Paenibacillus sp. P96]
MLTQRPYEMMWVIISIAILILGVGTLLFQFRQSKKKPPAYAIKSAHASNKSVIYILIDSLLASAIDQGIAQKKLPALQFLIQRGQYYRDVVTSFPTMSVTIDSSLMTGTYPDQHYVPGLAWYDEDSERVINYGTGPMEVVRQGIPSVLEDAVIRLNREYLNAEVPTIYEELSHLGYTCGSINGLVYRGPVQHNMTIPFWMRMITSWPGHIQVKGPEWFSLGALTNPLRGKIQAPQSILHRLGLNDTYSVETLKHLIRTDRLPDFLYVYMPGMDKLLHKKGPSVLEGAIEADKKLQAVLEVFGSPEQALERAVFVISGDSGVSQIRQAQDRPIIHLHELLEEYNVLYPGKRVTAHTEIVLAVNETMAYVYSLKGTLSLRDIAQRLVGDSRMDFVAWKEDDWMVVAKNGQELRFKAAGEWTDAYQQKWTIEGRTEMLDLQLDETAREIRYGKYPDVLQRILGSLNSHKGRFLIVGAKPGYELVDRSSPTHKGGGAHGSLSLEESLIPLVIAGTDRKPSKLRLVDLKAYLIDLVTDQNKKQEIHHPPFNIDDPIAAQSGSISSEDQSNVHF